MTRLLLVVLLALFPAACTPPEETAIQRAQVVKVCRDGTAIGRDPKTGRLVWSRWSGSGFVAAGLTAEQVCQ